jgi:hypothetical protein
LYKSLRATFFTSQSSSLISISVPNAFIINAHFSYISDSAIDRLSTYIPILLLLADAFRLAAPLDCSTAPPHHST